MYSGETYPSVTLYATNPIRTALGLKPDLPDEKLACASSPVVLHVPALLQRLMGVV